MKPPPTRIALLFFFFFFFFFIFFSMVVITVQPLPILEDEDENVTVTVNTAISIAKTDDNFICATLDWWPQDKCDYDQCSWGNASLLNLDLNNKILFNAVKAFKGLRIRVGGTLQDEVVYQVGKQKQCPAFKKVEGSIFGFEGGCLSMDRWDQLNHFFNQTSVKVTFGLNALTGRHNTNGNLWEGDWDPQNAADLMAYTIVKGYIIDSWELGNELSGGGIGARIEVEQYAKDMIQLKELVNHFYPYPATPKPKILGPGGFYEQWWFNHFLELIGRTRVIDAVTHHIYNLGPGDDKELIEKIKDPYYLESSGAETIHDAAKSVELFSPMAEVWVGESGGAFNSGSKDISHTFANGFWYLDQLGMASTFNHKVYCRQSLIGGNYGLLNTTSFIPNPDYYSALLWHSLMGSKVLKTTHNGSPYLRAYAHCYKESHHGITLLLINLSNSTTYKVSIEDDLNLIPGPDYFHHGGAAMSDTPREEYHLTPKNGNIQSDIVLLNGIPLKLTGASSDNIPDLRPELVDPFELVSVAPYSIVFAVLRGLKAPACGLQNH